LQDYLAAIMFTDMVGFSRQMSAMERNLTALRKAGLK
jgi:hypothetical protein